MDQDRLNHLPARKQRELQRVVRILFDEFEAAQKGRLSDKNKGGRILKLILFGSYARGDWVEDHASGYYSDYDLLVVVNTEVFADEDEFWRGAEEHLTREEVATKRLKTPVSFIVHSLEDVNDRLSRGQPFFIDIVRDGIPLYEAPGFPLTTPKPLDLEERRLQAQAYFDDFFLDASRQFELASEAMLRGYHKQAAFQLHQTVERLYHCLSLVLTLYTPKLHDLKELRSRAEGLDARLIEAWPRNSRFARRCFERLRRAYVEARYSLKYEIADEELAWLVEHITQLQCAVELACKERLENHDI
ncbi:HEPN domain-containing protein [Agrobacterium vitis]|uniref:HEPN domain-containing protein n=1 Tax=Agrobacterium vitis TaxID=373 RepID=A0AAE4WC81_AGRVI|nr:HEPN domain-containing protein [Agrobacterium vitis]MCF1498191.1 HEPN domain-containing protein [Allorhizobium sp. Av2]MCM2440315.1 HEPN domain-containing protein [Agrobacterium vitis]MUZ58111.1 HEPN domain-containing protein [Agrobacterium vitis]MVA66073.1 HEPN domain-containing protein [Agrobacterium vitis]MVA86991.1 HEPN domain-containing protein [Agrobacterium vitis]